MPSIADAPSPARPFLSAGIGAAAGTASILGAWVVNGGVADLYGLLIVGPLLFLLSFLGTLVGVLLCALPTMLALRRLNAESLQAYLFAAVLAALGLSALTVEPGNETELMLLLGYAVPTAAAFWRFCRVPALQEMADG